MSRNIFSDEAFADWLAKQPSDLEYDYTNAKDCLVTRYFRAMGLDCIGTDFGLGRNSRFISAPAEWDDIAMGSPDGPDTQKYGDALQRLRDHMAKEKVKEAA